jgi:hypothetical protein
MRGLISMHYLRKRYITLLAIALLGLGLYYAFLRLQNSCTHGLAPADSPATASAEASVLLRDATSLYDEQDYTAQNQPLTRPLKAKVSGRTANLWVTGPMYAGDFRYAQLWQHIYQRHHNGSPCVHLNLLWKNGGISQQFPPDTL